MRDAADTLGTIFAVTLTPDRLTVAGSEYGTYLVRSADGAWQSHQLPGDRGHYWMDAGSAYSLEYSAGFSTVSNFLQKTTDGGGRWQKLGKPLETPDFAGSIVYADPTEVLVQGLKALYSTRDEGQTWVRVQGGLLASIRTKAVRYRSLRRLTTAPGTGAKSGEVLPHGLPEVLVAGSGCQCPG
ncbi:hypothetical protein MW290_10760 [Aquincola tertiaricarbonis]|uniref:Photosynthesis system II assembly factor Ycf48/Hcf136-like domain-containing protein n=1 Tax=Aquincola tertiaricarbonis TaxID=391953 RepID=A0ABY4S340_AQUTE|nr:hypothetical protein [Aquincola tertiaricarbonis]URI06392.1 hypothetical protein MW290_10760 [Aquincola tertiaricarbonis]